MQKTRVVMDSDFLQGILRNGSEELYKQLMDELEVIPVVHPYVAEVELQYCKEAQKLINEGFIIKIEYSDFLTSDADKRLYNMQVWDIMDDISEKDLPPEKYRDVFRKDFRFTEHSIGEILSELMAKYMKLSLFVSNDYGAKDVAKFHINSSVYCLDVKNLAEILDVLIEKGTRIPWRQIKALLREPRWTKDKERLREKFECFEKEKHC